jgi:hypothetical protein
MRKQYTSLFESFFGRKPVEAWSETEADHEFAEAVS